MKTYYKVLNVDGTPYYGGTSNWHLPTENEPGEWMPEIKNIAMCKRGYHIVDAAHLVEWLGPAIFVVEPRGQIIKDENKFVCTEARLLRHLKTWNETTQRLFASDCAEHVLPFFEKLYPNDKRPREAIQAARELISAASAAASASWSATASAGSAAWSARSAAWSAAASAAASAGSAAEKAWQTKKLMQYLKGVLQ